MPAYSTDDIRNVALAGHQGAGKTTLFEALLHAGGAIQTAGSVERGSTVSDFDPMEKARGHSINASLASIDHVAATGRSVHVNLIDTPGFPDFRGPTLSCLAAVETCAVVVNAATGIEHGTARLMDYAKARRLCRLLVINKIEHEGIDLASLVEQLRETFGPECLPINLPASKGTRVVDCFFSPAGEADFSSVAEAPAHHRPGGRDQRRGDGQVSGRRRARPVRPATARCLRAMPARRPPGADLLRLGAQRRGREGTARPVRAPDAEPGRGQSAAIPQGQRSRCAVA
jgi:small GTP-binding protein